MDKLQQEFEAPKVHDFFNLPSFEVDDITDDYVAAGHLISGYKTKANYLATQHEKAKLVHLRKEELHQAGQLVEQQCLCCLFEPGTLSLEQKAIIWHKYHNEFKLSGFHCYDPTHRDYIHQIVGAGRWSCCE